MSASSKTTYQGHTVNALTKQLVAAANVLLRLSANGGETSDMTMTQGSYNTSVSASGGTHAGGGAADFSKFNAANREKVLRKLGGDAWRRTAISGVWPEHVHVIVDGDPTASPAAKDQMADYKNRRNGLANNGPDTGYHMYVFPRFIYGTTRARWINVVPCYGYSQPTARPETRTSALMDEGDVTASNDVCRVRGNAGSEWFVTKDGRFWNKANFVRRPSGYVALVETWKVTADIAYGRDWPGTEADKIGDPYAKGKTFNSIGYVTRDGVKYVLNRGGRWFTGTSLEAVVL